jgi:hypothetical protein
MDSAKRGAAVPLNPLMWIFATVNVLSAASLVLLATVALRLVTQRTDAPSREFLVAVIAIEVPLFLMGGGYTLFDPYAYGYSGPVVPLLMIALVVVGWIARSVELPIWAGLAALLYICNVYGSANLFDYLVDPLAALIAIAWLIGEALRPRRKPG